MKKMKPFGFAGGLALMMLCAAPAYADDDPRMDFMHELADRGVDVYDTYTVLYLGESACNLADMGTPKGTFVAAARHDTGLSAAIVGEIYEAAHQTLC